MIRNLYLLIGLCIYEQAQGMAIPTQGIVVSTPVRLTRDL
jgi:hypothetical protein